ncbi:hypothetical protein OG320_02635 [Microbispora sp. NBC_01189]|nr:hypothetical protein OG320_02635 [Microbispora sp. NBC_01189]
MSRRGGHGFPGAGRRAANRCPASADNAGLALVGLAVLARMDEAL